MDQYDYAGLFRIDRLSGDVRVNGELDITKVQKILYTVKAVDTSAEGPEQIGTGKCYPPILYQLKGRRGG